MPKDTIAELYSDCVLFFLYKKQYNFSGGVVPFCIPTINMRKVNFSDSLVFSLLFKNYILDTYPLLDMWSAHIFSHSVAFHYFHERFYEQKFSILMRSNLLIFSLMAKLLGSSLKTP